MGVILAEEDGGQEPHAEAGGEHETGSDPIYCAWNSLSVDGEASTGESEVEGEDGDKEQENVLGEDGQRYGGKEDSSHTPKVESPGSNVRSSTFCGRNSECRANEGNRPAKDVDL